MEAQFDNKKKFRVIRQYRNVEKKLDFDLYMNLKPDFKRVTTIQTRTIVEGCTTSEFVVVVEDEIKNKVTCEYWKGQKDSVSGVMQSKRQFSRNVDYEIGHLFVSEIIQNATAIPNNAEMVAFISDKILEFAKMEYEKAQKNL